MSCPFFHPTEPLSTAREARPVPLGDLYRGECRAEAYTPSDRDLRTWCNFGYARDGCGHFPADAPVDAARFAVVEDRDGVIMVRFCLERDHRPIRHGELRYERASRDFMPPHPDATINRLAQAYVEAYCRRTR